MVNNLHIIPNAKHKQQPKIKGQIADTASALQKLLASSIHCSM